MRGATRLKRVEGEAAMEKQALSADRPGATMVGFWRRAFAFLIDRVVLAIPASALAFPVSATGGFLSVPRVGRRYTIRIT
jgi:hypothetical protein